MSRAGQNLTVEEELYCTRYELEILSGIVTLNMLERWLPGFCGAQTHKEHVLRYDWVKDFVRDKSVLDIACGTGFGSFKLADDGGAASVTACDIDERTVKYASLRNRHPRISFGAGNAETFSFDKKFDVVTSFETIEHLRRPEAFLENVKQALDPNGIFFVSTPISNVPVNSSPYNIHHVTEWGFRRFHELVGAYFQVTGIFLQLYRHPVPPKLDINSRILRRLKVISYKPEPFVEKLEPHQWDPAELAEDKIGTVWTGYQILQCKMKKG